MILENEIGQPSPTQQQLPQRNLFQFKEARQPNIFFSSQFDSGNMHRVVKNTYDHYSIWTACDAQGTENEGYPKSWFYFEVGGFMNRKITFSVHRIHFLYSMCKRPDLYRPVCRIKNNGQYSQWGRLPHPILSLGMNNQQELVLKFDFLFFKNMQSVQFAFIYPYSYQQCREDVLKLSEEYMNDQQISLNQYQLIRSYENRVIDMLIISSHQGKDGFEKINTHPFTDKKIIKFRNNKPIIFISARVHPIETPASFCINGVIKFLLDKKDARAYLLRKYFVFVLVPMLNPDGVSRGHCRMDALNQNLNRYYSSPDPQKQPSCFAVKKLCEHYNKDKRIFMYLDLHAHPAFKGNFTFGNAIYQFVEQVESQLFSKVLSQNCISFEFQQCNFSRKHMKAKDRFQEISKEGAGRVVLYKQFGVVHSYTLECGYHMNAYNNPLQPQTNIETQYLVHYKINQKGQKVYESTQKAMDGQQLVKYLGQLKENNLYQLFQMTKHGLDNVEDQYYKRQIPIYTEQTFLNLGRNILISVLDIWNKNPYSRISDINQYRKEIADKQSKLDRFKKEQAGIKTKQKKIVQLIQQQFYADWHKRNVFNPNPTNPKKRNHTLNPVNIRVSQKGEKIQKPQVKQESKSQEQVFEQALKNSQQSLPEDKVKSANIIDSGSYASRNFKVRGKLNSTQGQHNMPGKERGLIKGTSLNRDLLASQMKLSEQQENKAQETMAISSKMIKNSTFNMGNHVRVRNLLLGSGMVGLKK